MKVFFDNTNVYKTNFMARAKKPKAIELGKANSEITKDSVQILNKKKLSAEQLKKINKFIDNRPVEIQNFYKSSIDFMNKNIDGSQYIKDMKQNTNDIIDKNIGLYEREVAFLYKLLEATDMFHPAAVNEKYFNKIIEELLISIK